VVTLERCNHVGRTPACRQALLDAGIVRVVIAVLDPTSREGGGAAALGAAGVDVELGVLADEARLVLAPWLTALRTHRPVVTWTYRIGADGLTAALALGRIADAEALRAQADAVLYEDGKLEEGIAGSHGTGVLQLPSPPLPDQAALALRLLYDGGVRTLLLSGGPELAERFLATGLVDELVVYVETTSPAAARQRRHPGPSVCCRPAFECRVSQGSAKRFESPRSRQTPRPDLPTFRAPGGGLARISWPRATLGKWSRP
jgi:diaminohydroxyphosphoribosylaminopyrimidine deaminase/5-amino-6-(5-phosphoribosylamino)uracil reductase